MIVLFAIVAAGLLSVGSPASAQPMFGGGGFGMPMFMPMFGGFGGTAVPGAGFGGGFGGTTAGGGGFGMPMDPMGMMSGMMGGGAGSGITGGLGFSPIYGPTNFGSMMMGFGEGYPGGTIVEPAGTPDRPLPVYRGVQVPQEALPVPDYIKRPEVPISPGRRPTP
ncbi:MAG: hypothetical protein ACREOH_03300 [Candidatus Entotheonellia bacterium]